MLPLNVQSTNEKGMTLLEILVVAVLVGILAALGLPQLLALLHRNQVQAAVDTLQNTLEDAQRQAIRTSQECTIKLSKTGSGTYYSELRSTITAGKPVCIINSSGLLTVKTVGNEQVVQLPDEIKMATNLSGDSPTISYSFKGHTTTVAKDLGETSDELPTIVVFPYNDDANTVYQGEQKCLVMASLLGVIRTGVYQGSLSLINSSGCATFLEGTEQP
jgi:prepilin-type N-terminal cleavage/methylation domain-containing protein